MPVKACYLVPTVGVSSAAEWEKKSERQLKPALAFKKVMRTFTNITRALWFRAVDVKKGIKKKVRHRWGDIPGCHDVWSVSCGHRYYIRRHFTSHERKTSQISNNGTLSSWCYLKHFYSDGSFSYKPD